MDKDDCKYWFYNGVYVVCTRGKYPRRINIGLCGSACIIWESLHKDHACGECRWFIFENICVNQGCRHVDVQHHTRIDPDREACKLFEKREEPEIIDAKELMEWLVKTQAECMKLGNRDTAKWYAYEYVKRWLNKQKNDKSNDNKQGFIEPDCCIPNSCPADTKECNLCKHHQHLMATDPDLGLI